MTEETEKLTTEVSGLNDSVETLAHGVNLLGNVVMKERTQRKRSMAVIGLMLILLIAAINYSIYTTSRLNHLAKQNKALSNTNQVILKDLEGALSPEAKAKASVATAQALKDIDAANQQRNYALLVAVAKLLDKPPPPPFVLQPQTASPDATSSTPSSATTTTTPSSSTTTTQPRSPSTTTGPRTTTTTQALIYPVNLPVCVRRS